MINNFNNFVENYGSTEAYEDLLKSLSKAKDLIFNIHIEQKIRLEYSQFERNMEPFYFRPQDFKFRNRFKNLYKDFL